MIREEDGLVFRQLGPISEFKRAESFQREVWGPDDPPDNSDIMLALQHEGALVAGAFEGDRMVGFLFGFPTKDPKIQHSHRLAVHPDARGKKLGTRLKWYQRDWCLERGIELVRWTYDPIRSINATLNIARIGATAKTYHVNYYGDMEGINAGVPSDRLVADWVLNDPRLDHKRTNGQLPEDDVLQRVHIPQDFGVLLEQDLEKALSERLRVRDELISSFNKGLKIIGFDPKNTDYLLA
ncbi:GNAT family N-acetyltransferase [Pseudovibrio sp. Tun.PSC04-5.I4]|uniref:GNAT family N-acetyltransferase n=1 Tax=Pseudovibrio sp. Tun.PSC04-5.I4 TaxID=1798213 RepID=UPI000888A03C|nr:GNAT family N-acetyltransferase [Pseudovibrio sp. Tun.PSC04-5.I4]SDR47283.1 Predicted acetyltransferase, GNAT superfamily [Pseudovibrio sp. Tun.PSC04-5.I4]